MNLHKPMRLKQTLDYRILIGLFLEKGNLFPFHPGFKDAFLAKLSPTGMLIYSVFYGGSQLDVAKAIAVSKGEISTLEDIYKIQGAAYTKNALQLDFGEGETKAFLAKVNSQGTSLIFSTYFGDDGLSGIHSIVLDSVANACICGAASTSNLVLVNPVQEANRNGADAIAAKIGASGRPLIFSSYLGGGKAELANAVAIETMKRLYVAGVTSSSSSFRLANPMQNRYGGGTADGFNTRIGNVPY